MKKNNGVISVYVLLAMMFFLIFIMVAYNNVSQKGKTQVETTGVLIDYYKSTQSAAEITNSIDGGIVSTTEIDDDDSETSDDVTDTDSTKKKVLKEKAQRDIVTEDNKDNFIYSNGKIYKIQ